MKHEKKLIERPWPACPGLPQKTPAPAQYGTKVSFRRYAAEVAEIDGDKALGVTVFNEAGAAQCRIWTNDTQYGVQTAYERRLSSSGGKEWTHEPGKMYQSAITTLYNVDGCGWGWGDKSEFESTEENRRIVLGYLGIDDDGKEPVKHLIRKQEKIAKLRLDRKKELERDRIRYWFDGIQDPPPEFREWLIDSVFLKQRYFFYNTDAQGRPGICSHCGKVGLVSGVKENLWVKCPHCGSDVQCRSLKRLKNSRGFGYMADVSTMEMVRGKVLLRTYDVRIRIHWDPLAGRVERVVNQFEDFRDFLDEGTFEVQETFGRPGTRAVSVDGFHFDHCGYGPHKTMMWPSSVKEVRTALGLYAPIELLAQKSIKADWSNVLRASREKPAIEYLLKMGFCRLAENEALPSWSKTNGVLLKEKGKLTEIFGITKQDINMIKKCDPSPETFMVARALLRVGETLHEADIQDLEYLKISKPGSLHKMLDRVGIRRALNYLKKQGGEGSGDHTLHLWRDYLDMQEKLHADTSDLMLAFPRRLKVQHDAAVAKLDAVKNEKLNRAVGKTAQKLQCLCWSFNGLIIRPATCHTELLEEGNVLHHCVGRAGYAEKMARGETAIFFIRKKETPDKPMATLELNLRTWEKIQCYAAYDKWPGEKVTSFWNKWIKNVVKPKMQKVGKTA